MVAQGYRGPAIAENDQLLGNEPDPGTGMVRRGGVVGEGGWYPVAGGGIDLSQYPPPPHAPGPRDTPDIDFKQVGPLGGRRSSLYDDKPPNTGFHGGPAGVGGEGDVGDFLREGGGEGLG